MNLSKHLAETNYVIQRVQAAADGERDSWLEGDLGAVVAEILANQLILATAVRTLLEGEADRGVEGGA